MYRLIIIIICFLSFIELNASQVEVIKDKKSKKSKAKQNNTEFVSSEKDVRCMRIFMDAQRLKMLNDYSGALQEFEAVLQIDSSIHAARFEMARMFYAMKQDDKALQNIELALKGSPQNAWYNLVYAEILAAKGKYKEAATVYKKIIVLKPKEISYYYDKAFMEEKAGMLSGALSSYDLIESKIGLDETVVLQKKRLYLSMGKVDKAAEEIQKLVDLYPHESRYYNMLAEVYQSNNQKERALEVYKKVLEKFPDEPYALLALADYHYQNGDRDKAIDHTLKAFKNKQLEIDLKVKILYQYVQFADAKRKEADDAFKLADALIQTHPEEAKGYALTGDLYYVFDKDSMALVFYDKSLEFRKDVYSVWQQELFLNSDLNRFDTLLKRANEAIEIFPNQSLPYFFKGVALQNLVKYTEAITAFNKALKISSENKILQSQILSGMGDVFHLMNQNIQSDSCYEEAIRKNPENTYAMNNYSYYLSVRAEKLERAEYLGSQIVQLDKDNPSYLDTYAWILFKSGKYSQALEWQLKAINMTAEPSAVMHEHLGDIYFKTGNTTEAIKHWQEAKKMGSQSETLLKKLNDGKWYEGDK